MTIRRFIYRITHWETWYYITKYIPLAPVWIWYCLRARSCWFFTPSNPTLTFGGFEGESKKEMYDQLPPGSYPKSIYVDPQSPIEDLPRLVVENDFSYPFVVKPDIGMMGFMFRTIENEEQLKAYHQKMPATYILQEQAPYPIEVSVFYYRFPHQQKGHITGFVKKEFLQVVGDGESSLEKLIREHPRVLYRLKEQLSKHESRLHEIIPNGEIFVLSHALNLSRGSRLISLAHEKDDKLLKIFDDLSHYARHFYYGRYDIKCASIDDLKQGKNFTILEYNGSGAEPHHIYGNNNSLWQAYRILVQHWEVLYQISRFNHLNGHPYWPFRKGLSFLKTSNKYFKDLKRIDKETELP